jgi:hypothetical protein
MAVKKVEKKPTEYVVLRSIDLRGPFTVIGNFTTHGQIAAKKAAAAELAHKGEEPEANFFVAVPASSFYPQKPVVQMTITFLSAEGTEEPEVDDEPEDESEDEPDEDESPEQEEETPEETPDEEPDLLS